MKKMIASLLMLSMLIGPSVKVFADSTQVVDATYNTPKTTMYDDLNSSYDITSTLRMTFPDACFKDNLTLINDIISGKRNSITKDASASEIGYLYGSRLYLLPLQLKNYDYEMYKIGEINPYFDNLLTAVNQNPTEGRQDLMQMQLANYMQLGFMNPLD